MFPVMKEVRKSEKTKGVNVFVKISHKDAHVVFNDRTSLMSGH